MSSATPQRRRCSRVGVVVACLLAGAIGSVGPIRAQAPAAGPGGQRPAQPPAAAAATGTGVITGIISGGDTGRPLRRVRVTLTNSVTNASLGTAVTDAEGRFTFTRLPAGSLTLRAVRTGYLDIVFGQKTLGSGRPGTPIQLAEGQKIENLALQMPRGGVISGMVVDDVGEPAASGQYSFQDLPPGEYYLAALTELAPDDWRDPEFLEQVVGAALRVTVGPGEQKVQGLRIGGGTPNR